MESSRQTFYRGLFLVSAIYDVALGIVFTFFGGWAFDLLGIRDKMPSGAYVPLLGAFLFVIGVAYFLIYRGDLYRNWDLIVVGVLYKFAYCSIALVFWATGQLPHVLFAALFGVADAVFLVLMMECLIYLRAHPQGTGTQLGKA
jgi:formate/nitrite transporter FocA (FNT family)